jgi:hypothetical protein
VELDQFGRERLKQSFYGLDQKRIGPAGAGAAPTLSAGAKRPQAEGAAKASVSNVRDRRPAANRFLTP